MRRTAVHRYNPPRMDRSFLLQTKFLVPRYGTDLIARPELLARLKTAVSRRLTLLSAPPGYGKTTLLAELTEQLHLPYVWYQLDAADGDPTIFLSCLIACARDIEAAIDPARTPTVGSATESLLEDSEPAPPERILTVLINELVVGLPGEYVLILEDYHVVTNPDVHRLVNILLDSGPPGLHLILSSRTDPPLGLSRLRARGRVAEYRAADLRFGAREVEQWLIQVIPDATAATASLLAEKTEGWAAALQIVLSSLAGKDADSAGQFIADLTGTQRFVFEYLAEEVFQQHPPERRRFLTHTAVLEQMNAAACNALLGSNNAQPMLDRLEKDNLFVVSLDEKREWYRYHHLFREFLLGKLRGESPARVAALEERAAAYYTRKREPEAAFIHYTRAQNYAAAASVLTRFARDYVERGRVAVLQRYLGDLPDDLLGNYPELLLQHGNVLWRQGRVGAAVARYEDAQAVFAQQGDAAGVCQALTQLAELARSQGDYRRARDLAQTAVAAIPQDDYAQRSIALMSLAKSEGFLTGMDRGRELAEESVALARKAADALPRRVRANLLRSLGHICWWHGDPQATLRFCQEALMLVPDDSPIAASIYITMATPVVYRGDFARARAYAGQGLDIAERLQLPELLPRAHSTLGSILSRCGEPEAGERHLRQAVELAQELGLESYARVMAAGYLAQNLCGQGRSAEARQLAEAALWERAANPDTYEMVVCRSVLADIALENDDLDAAQVTFESLVEVGERRQFRIPLAMVYFGLAYVLLRNGRDSDAIQYARESVAILEPLNTWQLYLDQGERARSVCQALVRAGEVTPFVEDVLQRLAPDTAVAGAALQAVTATRDGRVRVTCFGPFRVYVDGAEITQERWVSAKARDLLAYFITFRHDRIPLEKAAEAVWPEADASGRAFHSALYRLRQALRRGGENTKFIQVKGGEYWLDSTRFAVDVDAFEAACDRAAAGSGAKAVRAYEEAVALYTGDYLSNMLYDDWPNDERRRLEARYLRALRELAHAHAATGNYEAACEQMRRALQLDSLHEDSVRSLMRFYAEMGNRTAVIRQYHLLEEQLKQELGVAPAPETRQLIATLLQT